MVSYTFTPAASTEPAPNGVFFQLPTPEDNSYVLATVGGVAQLAGDTVIVRLIFYSLVGVTREPGPRRDPGTFYGWTIYLDGVLALTGNGSGDVLISGLSPGAHEIHGVWTAASTPFQPAFINVLAQRSFVAVEPSMTGAMRTSGSQFKGKASR